MNLPRVIIAGTNSGCGKTTVAAGIMAALVRRGRKVQPYKTGPDYIDPMFHTYLTGRASRNLDTWLLKPEVVCQLLADNARDCDLAVIEGVMGFYDGVGVSSLEGSTAQLAQLTRSPVVLVVDAAGMALSVAALIRGFQEFAPGIEFGGVILNHVNSQGHFQLLKQIIAERNGLPALGYLPQAPEVELPSRHLGLVPGEEVADLSGKLERLADLTAAHIDLDALLAVAGRAEAMPPFTRFQPERRFAVRLGVARDAAFNFYYQDNLDLLATCGAELVDFSPLRDTTLPEGLDGIYLGGGFPEVFAAELEANQEMRAAVQRQVQRGLPVYAECGGLMYLCNRLTNADGQSYAMCGCFSARSEMTGKLQHFGYVMVKMVTDTILGQSGAEIRGHEFHYSRLVADPGAATPKFGFEVAKRKMDGTELSWPGGIRTYNALGSYPHLHFWANPAMAEYWLQSCVEYRLRQHE